MWLKFLLTLVPCNLLKLFEEVGFMITHLLHVVLSLEVRSNLTQFYRFKSNHISNKNLVSLILNYSGGKNQHYYNEGIYKQEDLVSSVC